MGGSRLSIRKLAALCSAVVVALSAVPAPAIAVGPPQPPDVAAVGTNVYQASPNGPIYFRPMAGRAPYDLVRTYGAPGKDEYRVPSDAVVVGSYVYVLDSGNMRIVKRKASNLAFVKESYGLAAHGVAPASLASDGTYLYVTDAGPWGILVFKVSNLAYVGHYGPQGSGKGKLTAPKGIAVSGGRIYVADGFNNRLVKLTTWPISWVKSYGSVGNTVGKFHYPSGIAVIGSNVYVADAGNNRLVRLSNTLTGAGWLVKSSYGSPPVAFSTPWELAADGTHLYLFDAANHAVVKFTSAMSYVTSLVSAAGPTAFNTMMGMGASTAGLFLVHYGSNGAALDNQVTKNSRTTLATVATSGHSAPSPDKFLNSQSVAADAANIYLADAGRILVCPRSGSTCTRSITTPIGITPAGLASDGTSLYATNANTQQVHKFDIATGSLLTSYGAFGTGVDQLKSPGGIAFNPVSGGQLYIADCGNNRIVVRKASDLTSAGQFGSAGSGNTQFSCPSGIATDGPYLYITDAFNHRVVKYTAQLMLYQAQAGSLGTGPGQFQIPLGLASDGDSVWVTDPSSQRIQHLRASDLAYVDQITQIGGTAFANPGPADVASADGKLIIMDAAHKRVHELQGNGPLKLTATPSDASTPIFYVYDWSGGVPAGWSPTHPITKIQNPGIRYLGWTKTAVGGSVSVELEDNTLTLSAPRVVALVPDATAPTVTRAPAPEFGPQMGASLTALPAAISFRGADAGAGVGSAELWRSVNGGAWTPQGTINLISGAAANTVSFLTTLSTSKTYRFRARVTDKVGNVSAWKYGPTFRPGLVQENGLGVTVSSGWIRKSLATTMGGYVRSATAVGKTLTYTGSISAVAIISAIGPSNGAFKIYVDGVLKEAPNTNDISAATRKTVFVYSWATKGTHKIKIVTLGGGATVIDAFVVAR